MAARDWSRKEVEATVADYFSMLDSELRGTTANKAEHNRRLSLVLDNRSHSAIERKHQNISAILRELEFPYISGYKPFGNYQRLLRDVVVERLSAGRDLVSLVESHVVGPAEVPDVPDILDLRVEAPARRRVGQRPSPRHPEVPRQIRTNYFELEARNRSLGSAGEELVVRYEVARLRSLDLDRLASRVERVSVTRGDAAGFDVRSFEESGDERWIEVKTTAYGRETPFYVTRNELDVSQQNPNLYLLYRVFDFRRDPHLFTVPGRLDVSFELDPSQYVARVA